MYIYIISTMWERGVLEHGLLNIGIRVDDSSLFQ